ncbi:MAG: GNAT family N-acetyltransferase [Polyangiaceae bacterium]
MWTRERKLEACQRAPLVRAIRRRDTRIVERPGWYQVITPSAPPHVLNEVAFSQVDEADVERTIDEVIAEYAAAGQPVKWCVGPWTRPRDLGERLAKRGFRVTRTRGMVCETSLELGPPSTVAIEEVREENLDDYLRGMMRGWSFPEDQLAVERASHLEAMRATERVAYFFVARSMDEVLGTAWLVDRGDYGYLVGAQVLEHARGRGLYRALMAARLTHLRERGIGLAVTQAREATSAPILEKLGLDTVFRSECWFST